jgi:malate dehydrogenase
MHRMTTRRKISIIGAGNVGAAAAHRVMAKNLGDVVLVDVVEGLAQGKALDLAETGPVEGFDFSITGTNAFGETRDSDVVIVTAGLARKPGMSRDDLLLRNFTIVKDATEQVTRYSPHCFIIVVTNPLDVMAYTAWRVSRFPRNRVMGMAGVLDSARMRAFIAIETGVSPEDISAFVLGGHGDDMVPLVRYCSVGGIPLEKMLAREKIDAIVERTRKAGGEIVSLLKTGSAYYSPSASAVAMAETILKDRKRVLPCSASLDGEYGVAGGLFAGVPVLLGGGGVEKVIEVDLVPAERAALEKSVFGIREMVKVLPL